MTDSLPTHPASTDSPAEGGAVAWRARYRPGGESAPWTLHQREPSIVASLLADYEVQPLYTRPAPIEPGVREKVGYADQVASMSQAMFLIDRLDEYEREIETESCDGAVRYWMGHVAPALARLRSALLSSNTGEG